MNRLSPLNWRTKAPGAGCPHSESAARYKLAGQPSVRSTSIGDIGDAELGG